MSVSYSTVWLWMSHGLTATPGVVLPSGVLCPKVCSTVNKYENKKNLKTGLGKLAEPRRSIHFWALWK